jgi:hypothetical protein
MLNKNAEHPVFKTTPTDFLRQKYEEGLNIGGVQGTALCHAVERAGEEVGVSVEQIVEPFRTDEQRKSLDDARRLTYFSDLISTKGAPEPPRSLTKAVQRARREMHRPLAPVMLPGSSEPITVSETPHTGRKKKKKKSA